MAKNKPPVEPATPDPVCACALHLLPASAGSQACLHITPDALIDYLENETAVLASEDAAALAEGLGHHVAKNGECNPKALDAWVDRCDFRNTREDDEG